MHGRKIPKDGVCQSSLGKEFQSWGATIKKVLVLVEASLASTIDGA